MSWNTIAYAVSERVATITLNRPDRMNAINDDLPRELAEAVRRADDDDDVHAIILQGAGSAFCAGYDLKEYAEGDRENLYTQSMPWDPMIDYRLMKANTDAFSTLWRCYKPTIAKVHGFAVAGGSDIALCCDLIVMADDAKIGYPPTRVWGCPSTGMWVHRLGAQQAKRMLFTGDLIDGQEAVRIGLALESVPADQLDERVTALAARMSGVPKNQLMMQKLMINQAIDAQGMQNTQMVATLFDGITRHSPEGLWFKELSERVGFQEAVRKRDSGEPLGPGSN